jgi:phosphatidate cytidylyltransferase
LSDAPEASGTGAVTAPAGKSTGWSMRLRVISSIAFVPLLWLLVRSGGVAFLAFVAVQVVAGLLEFYGMMRRKSLEPTVWFGLVLALGVLWVVYRPEASEADFLATAGLLLGMALALRRPELTHQIENVAVTLFGVLYVGWLSAHFVLLRELPWRAGLEYDQGASFVFLAFLVTWGCDTGAFLVGRTFGRTRPWTKISPRKSTEGAIGGFVTATVAAFVARAWFAPYLSPWDAAAIGVLVGVFAQVGDFVESLFKRDARHDDSSDLIPGHGGVLDRFDSLYFGAPIVYYYLKIVVFRVP